MTDKTPTVTVLAAVPAPSKTLAAVEASESGYSLHISCEGKTYTAILTKPDGRGGMHLYRWPGLAAVYESMGTYFMSRGLQHIWSALRASVDAELKP